MRRTIACLILSAILLSCQPQGAPRIKLVVDGQALSIAASDLVPAHLLANAGVAFSPADRVLVNGMPVALDQPIQSQRFVTLQLRRALPVTLIAPNGQITVNTAASTVGEALREAGVNLFVSDRVTPSVETAITSGMTVTITPGREMTVLAAGQSVRVRSSAATVGQVLAEAGIPLVGLDSAVPSENDALPSDGQVRIVRVTESIDNTYKIIPYDIELIVTAELQPPAQDVLDPGEVGISLSRTRFRYEDGVVSSNSIESESIIRLPRTRVVRSSYWASTEMYATSYSPCNARGVGAGCFYTTASGLHLQHGVVGMLRDWYFALKGTRVYVPGYGIGIVADTGGGFPDGRPLIDLGYSESDYVGWSSWVTVYFLAPAPLEIPWFLQ